MRPLHRGRPGFLDAARAAHRARRTRRSPPGFAPVGVVFAISRTAAGRAETGTSRLSSSFAVSVRIVMTRSLRSTSRQINPRSSPRRIPVSSAARMSRCSRGPAAASSAASSSALSRRVRFARRASSFEGALWGDWRSGEVALARRPPERRLQHLDEMIERGALAALTLDARLWETRTEHRTIRRHRPVPDRYRRLTVDHRAERLMISEEERIKKHISTPATSG